MNPCFAVIILLVHHFSKHFPKQWLNHLWKVIRKIGLLLPYFHQLIINANSTETLMPILFSDCSRIFPWVDNLSEKNLIFRKNPIAQKIWTAVERSLMDKIFVINPRELWICQGKKRISKSLFFSDPNPIFNSTILICAWSYNLIIYKKNLADDIAHKVVVSLHIIHWWIIIHLVNFCHPKISHKFSHSSIICIGTVR